MIYPPNRVPKIIGILIGVMLGGSVLSITAPETAIALFGLIPRAVTQDLWLWQLVTYLALHGGLLHLLFNMFALYMFGTALAIIWGDRKFLAYFIYCGTAAAALTIAL
ncbi:MAG: rhomboid family intramembrane serine protease, partial [Elusimicrobiota bacterium]